MPPLLYPTQIVPGKATLNKSNTYFPNVSQVPDNAFEGFGKAPIPATTLKSQLPLCYPVSQDPGQSGKANIQTVREHTQMESKDNRNKHPEK